MNWCYDETDDDEDELMMMIMMMMMIYSVSLGTPCPMRIDKEIDKDSDR